MDTGQRNKRIEHVGMNQYVEVRMRHLHRHGKLSDWKRGQAYCVGVYDNGDAMITFLANHNDQIGGAAMLSKQNWRWAISS